MAKISPTPWSTKLAGYLLIPHELRHVLGYRLVGYPCRYRWGESYVLPPLSILCSRDLIGTLFPFFIFFSLTLASGW